GKMRSLSVTSVPASFCPRVSSFRQRVLDHYPGHDTQEFRSVRVCDSVGGEDLLRHIAVYLGVKDLSDFGIAIILDRSLPVDGVTNLKLDDVLPAISSDVVLPLNNFDLVNLRSGSLARGMKLAKNHLLLL